MVKPEDNRSKVGEHFKKIGDGLKNTKDKLAELGKEIVATPNADIKGVEAVIQSSSAVISKLISSVTKLAEVTKEGSINIGDNVAGAAVAAHKESVEAIIKEVKAIIETATNSGMQIEKGNPGGEVNTASPADAPAVLTASGSANQGAGSKLADVLTQADSWAMIDKIKNAKIKDGALNQNDSNDAGELATGTPGHANGSKAATNADLAAAVALKAMTKSGKFSANNADSGIVKAAAASAVNKVLRVLDAIINKAVNLELGKIKDAVKGIKYSETTGINVPEAGTTQIPATK